MNIYLNRWTPSTPGRKYSREETAAHLSAIFRDMRALPAHRLAPLTVADVKYAMWASEGGIYYLSD